MAVSISRLQLHNIESNKLEMHIHEDSEDLINKPQKKRLVEINDDGCVKQMQISCPDDSAAWLVDKILIVPQAVSILVCGNVE